MLTIKLTSVPCVNMLIGQANKFCCVSFIGTAMVTTWPRNVRRDKLSETTRAFKRQEEKKMNMK